MSVLIKNGHIFTAVDSYVADILVDDGKIRTIGIDLSADAENTIDATGKYVIPGGIDPHTHLDFPFRRHRLFRRLQHRHHRGGGGGHHQHCRLCRAATGWTRRKDNFSPTHSRSRTTHESSSTSSRKGKASLKPGPTSQQALEPGTRKIRIRNPRPRRSDLTRRPPSYLAQSKRPKIGRNTIVPETRNPNERNTSGNTAGSKTKSPRKRVNAGTVPTRLSQSRPGARLVPKSTGGLAGRVTPPGEQGKRLRGN